jgi:Mce-associated membrane protein
MARRRPDRSEEAPGEPGGPVSPRRRVDDGDNGDNGDEPPANVVRPDYFRVSPKAARRWGLPLAAALAAVVMATAITVSALILFGHEVDRRTALNDAAALGFTREFMADYTTLDPSDASGYADRILAHGTGEFAKVFKEKQNEILVQVAAAEPSLGTVLEAGVQRWNGDGSVEVLLALKVATTTPDGKSMIETGSRWVATTVNEGQRWKISNLVQVL